MNMIGHDHTLLECNIGEALGESLPRIQANVAQLRYSKEWVGWKGANGDEIGTSLRILSSGQS